MYGGQPPFRPPFAPTMQPGQGGPPPGFPPFPPAGGQQAFTPPPFAPNFAPGAPPPGYGMPPQGFRPPPGGPSPNGRPAHPGLGLPPLPAGLPRPPSYGNSPANGPGTPGAPPVFRKDVKTTSVFVGSIAPGIADITLTNLLNACGPLHELKRITSTTGKAQAFGFALFENPEVAMRCIRCLNGVELPDMTPEGRREGNKKPLLVKVDDKTREFLEEFESTVGRSEDDENADASCRRSIAHIVALLTDPNAPPPSDFKPIRGQSPPLNLVVPAHLQDLKEGDLPENQRVAVLDQIAIFRVQAAKREREKARLDTEKEKQKLEEAARNPRGQAMGNYGYGNRGLEQDRQRQWGAQAATSPSSARNGRGSFSGGSADAQRATPVGKGDAQGYDKPVGFVKAETAEGKGDERTDEEEEEIRRQKQARERDYAFRERERRVEDRERRRLDALSRENARRRGEADHEEKLRRRQVEAFEEWDDDEKMDRGREWFYADRARWRSQRRLARDREFKDDLRDRHLEEDERRKAEADAEAFLKQQQIELAELEARQKARGLLTEDAAPIKLDINAVPRPAPKEAPRPEAVAHKPGVAFDEDEETEEAGQKKKRTLVKLEYDADQPLGEEITEAERIARRNAKLLSVRRMVPSDRRALWETPVEWAALSSTIVEQKIKPFVRNKMKDLLGEVDEDLAEFVLEHLRDRRGPDDLVDGLEPVFAEEAVRFVVALWRQVVFESAAYKVSADTGDVMI